MSVYAATAAARFISVVLLSFRSRRAGYIVLLFPPPPPREHVARKRESSSYRMGNGDQATKGFECERERGCGGRGYYKRRGDGCTFNMFKGSKSPGGRRREELLPKGHVVRPAEAHPLLARARSHPTSSVRKRRTRSSSHHAERSRRGRDVGRRAGVRDIGRRGDGGPHAVLGGYTSFGHGVVAAVKVLAFLWTRGRVSRHL